MNRSLTTTKNITEVAHRFARMVSFRKRYLPISQNWNASTERLVAPSPAASSPPLSHFSSPRLLYFPYESLRHFMSGLFVSQPPFPFQVWPDLE